MARRKLSLLPNYHAPGATRLRIIKSENSHDKSFKTVVMVFIVCYGIRWPKANSRYHYASHNVAI